jgi:hypothetical protein
LQTEGRINTLIDLVSNLSIEADHLSIESKKLYEEIILKPELSPVEA